MSRNTTLPVSIPEDVLAFCTSHGLIDPLEVAIRLAEEAYAPVRGWEVSLLEDPDVEYETYFVIVDVAVSGTVDEVMAMHRQFDHAWMSAQVSPSGRHYIRVLAQFD